MWYHVCVAASKRSDAEIKDVAWCYPEPLPGREKIKNHITFATNKGVGITIYKKGALPPSRSRVTPQQSNERLLSTQNKSKVVGAKDCGAGAVAMADQSKEENTTAGTKQALVDKAAR